MLFVRWRSPRSKLCRFRLRLLKDYELFCSFPAPLVLQLGFDNSRLRDYDSAPACSARDDESTVSGRDPGLKIETWGARVLWRCESLEVRGRRCLRSRRLAAARRPHPGW